MFSSSKSNVYEVIERQIAQYFEDKNDVVAVYLFGSYAVRKDSHRSDIDIGIIFDGKDREVMTEKKLTYMSELSRTLRKDIHPVALNIASQQLLRQVFEKGTCIFVNDEKKLARFKMLKFVEIADFGYTVRQMQSGFIRKIGEARDANRS